MSGLPPGMTQERIDREDLPWGDEHLLCLFCGRRPKWRCGDAETAADLCGVKHAQDKEG